jgi:hypothetical protein
MMKRPTGITVMAVLLAIGGVFGIIGALGSFGLGMAGIGILSLIIAVVSLALAYGLWTLKPWAWMGALGLEVFNALYAIVLLIAKWSTLWNTIISLAIAGIIIYYLMRPEIKAAFGRS